MTREQDFAKASTQFDGIYAQVAFCTGCEHGYQYAVDKACEWLEKYAANFVALPDEGQQPIGDTNAIYGTKSLLYYLRKEMEELL
jgi:hypothetical protein